MSDYESHHATIFLPPEVAGGVEAVRRAWDPGMAAQIAAHITLVYPQEAPDAVLLAGRLRAACASAGPFRLGLGAVACFEDDPAAGIYVAVADPDGGWAGLRAEVLSPPFAPSPFPPHITLIHPRTSTRGPAFWAQGPHPPFSGSFTVAEIALTAWDGARWVVCERYMLGPPPTVLVGALLLYEGAVLLGHRAPHRAFYPGVWDFVGGHVEPGETPELALVRELQEEVGITATAFTPHTVWHTEPGHPAGPLAYHLYYVTAWQGTPTNCAPAEHTTIRWVPLAEASALDLADEAYRPLFAQLLTEVLSNDRSRS